MTKKVAGPTRIGPATTQTTTSDYNAKRGATNGTALTPKYTHLYYTGYRCFDSCYHPNGEASCYDLVACPVTRVTAKRIYFRDGGHAKWRGEREHFVSRAAIEPAGETWHRELGERLRLEPPPLPDMRRFQQENGESKSLAELRKEAADLHPDRGGDPDQFRAAHARYTAAKAATR